VATDEPRFDAAGSLGIGVLLLVIATILAIEMRSLLVGEAASPAMQRDITGAIEGAREVHRIIHIKTLHLGPDELLVAAKIELDASSLEAAAQAINVVEARIRAAVPIARVIYLEPDVFREKPAPATP
jgi:divalent metal cation (Fe/Co/Zn/Cd) transporter